MVGNGRIGGGFCFTCGIIEIDMGRLNLLGSILADLKKWKAPERSKREDKGLHSSTSANDIFG